MQVWAVMQPFPQTLAPRIVTRDVNALGLQYTVRPQIGATPVYPADYFNRGELIRGWTVTRRLPWTPQSYPNVGREPGMFLPPDVPAIPANANAPVTHRKSQLGRVVSSGTPSSAPGAVTAT